MERIQKTLQLLEEQDIYALLVTSESNVTYLSGFTGDSSRLFIANQSCYLITDPRYIEQAKNECHKDIIVFEWINDKRYNSSTYDFLIKLLKIKNIGFESNHITFQEYSEINGNKVPTQNLVEQIRLIKSKDEIENLRKASQISDKALENTLSSIKEGVTEIDIVAELEYNLKKCGADNLSFETMVLSGKRTSLLHGKPSQKRIEKGDLILFDFGALYNGYHADISRSFVLGQANDQQRKIYDCINNAGKLAINSIKEGVEGKEIAEMVRKQIPSEYLEYYYPGIGHGVGLDIHENPFIKDDASFTFQSGMVITMEPGIYIPEWGGLRIEDTLLVTKNGCEPLNLFERNLIEL
ncbi:MAG: aminopeptidase P family protein [Labilibaculum sp.]|nr:Xaa-Pro peptidase family protein [Labilibaculum sp.]MBI9058316.1 aminopeptidase P family protein [Labilibaculum sp.]